MDVSSPGLEGSVVLGKSNICSHRGRKSRSLVCVSFGRGRRKRGRMVRCVAVLRVVAGLNGHADIVDAGQLMMYTGYKHQAG